MPDEPDAIPAPETPAPRILMPKALAKLSGVCPRHGDPGTDDCGKCGQRVCTRCANGVHDTCVEAAAE